MEYFIDTTSQKELESLFNDLKSRREKLGLKGGKSVGFSHLKMSLFDWRVEDNWSKENAFVRVARNSYTGEILGGTFWTHTTRGNRHASFRHIFLFEDWRGNGIAEALYNYRLQHTLERGVKRVRLFANIPATNWHLKCGMRFIAQNKAGQPFTYLPLFDVENVKELGQKYDELGFDKCIEMVQPEVDKQVNRLIGRGGRWLTKDEINLYWKLM